MHACLDSKMIFKTMKSTRVARFAPSFSHHNYFSQDNKSVIIKPCIKVNNVQLEKSPLEIICCIFHAPTFP
jgi:hypothetical protein